MILEEEEFTIKEDVKILKELGLRHAELRTYHCQVVLLNGCQKAFIFVHALVNHQFA